MNMEPVTDIDMMPLTSMALVILLILILISPGISNKSSDIELPLSETSQDKASSQIIVTLTAGGIIEIDGIEINFSGLKPLLGDKLKASPESVLLIRADKKLLYSNIEPLLRLGRVCGAKKISIGVCRKNEP
ncbi:biopolymer transporter ExbD [bacterium]|nr:biopolymer transporter ExbD [bacterium]